MARSNGKGLGLLFRKKGDIAYLHCGDEEVKLTYSKKSSLNCTNLVINADKSVKVLHNSTYEKLKNSADIKEELIDNILAETNKDYGMDNPDSFIVRRIRTLIQEAKESE